MVRKKLYYKRTKHFVMILFGAVIEVEVEIGGAIVWSLLQNVLENGRAEDSFS